MGRERHGVYAWSRIGICSEINRKFDAWACRQLGELTAHMDAGRSGIYVILHKTYLCIKGLGRLDALDT